MLRHLLYIISLCALVACSSPQANTPTLHNIAYQTDSLQYAQHFSLQHAHNHTLLTIHNPWQAGQILAKYYLVKHDSVQTPTDGTRLIIPLTRVCVQSAPHIGYIDALHQSSQVVGACSPQLFYSPALQALYQAGKVTHLGDAYQMHLEKITQLQPNLLITTAYPQADPLQSRLQENNIPTLPTVEWTEPNLLARAEWIKVYGLLFNQRAQADSLFAHTAQAYHQLAQQAEQAQDKPNILSGLPYKDTWYMPGGNSFMGQLFKHANVAYHYSNNQQTNSLPLSIETVWFHFNTADMWVGIDANSKAELQQTDHRLTAFKAFKDNKLYHYRKRTTPQGGNDFWESAVVFPHRLLRDLIIIAHPALFPNDSTYYAAPLP